MDYRRLGRSSIEVSTICLGTMNFGDRTNRADASSIVAAARDLGVNFIDTADVYGKGESERITGAAIAADRPRWILATKACNPMDARERNNGGLSRRWLTRACDDSLARLATDWIDVYYLHKDDVDTPVEEFVATLGDLVRAGKIRYFGLSNFRGWRIAGIAETCDRLGIARPIVCQPYYNLLNRMPEVEILPACDRYGLGVAPYSPVARGVLTGKYSGGAVPTDSRAAVNDRRIQQTELRAESYAIADTLKTHAAKTGRTPTAFAMAWLWANPIVSSVIAGPRTMAQWRDYAGAVGTKWTADDEALVDSLVTPGHPSTPGYNDPQYPFYGRVRRG